MMTKPNFTTMVLSMTLAASLTAGCKKETPPSPPPTIEFVTIEQRDVPVYGTVVGTLEADVNATISAQVAGNLLSREYTEGSAVTNGQVLFKIDARTYKAALDQAEAKVKKTQLDVERYSKLVLSQAISQQELDDAIQANAAAVAAAEQARLNYEFCTICSPVNGVAGLAQAQVGDLVGPSTGPLTSVTTMDPIRVYFSVAQQMMTQIMEHRLSQGRTADSRDFATLQLELSTGTVYPEKGQFRFANNQVDVKTGTIRLVGEFPNPNRLLIPGMFVRVRAQIGVTKNALLVPQRAVAELQGRRLVAVIDADNKVMIRPVTTGTTEGNCWVISGPIKAGDRIVAEGIQKVRDGIVVNPVPFAAQTKAASPAAPKPASQP